MKTRLFVFLLLIFAFTESKAQYYFFNGDYYENNLLVEVGGSFGAMNAFTDLGGRRGIGKKFIKDFNIKNTRIQGGLFVGLMFKNSVGLRLEATFGKVTAYDSILRKVAPSTNGRYERNLEFKSPISEIALMGEFHPFEMFGNYGEDRYPPEVSPYIVAGVGFFKFNPQATLNGGLVDLHPLRTEGQGFAEYPRAKEYSLRQMSFPFGAGARYDISVTTNIRVEIIYRFTTTDYLDDVSGKYIDPIYFANYLSGYQLNQALLLHDRHIPGAKYSTAHPDGVRGNPNNKDGYVTLNLKLGLTIGRDRR
ncbi:MAG: hypothetical protein J5I50_07320 [Chitinophagaceae bacterium]|nr:hypothetical protein [Chitinophagaceae bacterium]